MHPLLFEIPLPEWQLPLRHILFGGIALGVLVAFLGWRARARDIAALGMFGALLGAILGFRAGGESYAVSDLPIFSYGALLATAFALGWFVSMRLSTRSGISRASAANAYFATGLSALVGARVLYVLTNLRQFHSVTMALDVQSGGLVAYGGFLGGLFGAWLYGRVSGNGLLAWADSAAPAVAFGLFLTRIGCYLFGCDFGRPLSSGAPAWLRRLGTFPRWDSPSLPLGTGAPAWQSHVERALIDFDATASLPVHPTQLYESCVGLVIFLGLLWAWQHKRFNGQVLLTLGATYGTARFFLELWRDDPERGAFGPLFRQGIGVASALFAMGLCAALGPIAELPRRRWRHFAQGAAFLPSLVGYWLTRPEPGTIAPRAQWSTSQWLGLLSVIVSCLAWAKLGARSRIAVAGAASYAMENGLRTSSTAGESSEMGAPSDEEAECGARDEESSTAVPPRPNT